MRYQNAVEIIVENNNLFYVMSNEIGENLAGPFSNHSKAWDWVDAHDQFHLDAIDRQARIRQAFSER